jgi:hypothetical protein
MTLDWLGLDWLTWSNSVSIWWGCLVAISAANIALLLWLHSHFPRMTRNKTARNWRMGAFASEPLLLLSAAYVFGCAFRSVLPRADIQRICLFDTWLSSVFVGRSVATVAEICFAIQWAIVLRELANITNSDTARNISRSIVPLILLAECCSWYAVIATDFLGNAVENSIWTATYILVAIALLRLMTRFRGVVQFAIATAAAGIAGYVVFMASVDVPMYLARWQADLASGKQLFGILSGLHDVTTHWIVTHNFTPWKDEMAWMSLYFSLAVWASLALGGFGLVRHRLLACRVDATPAGRPTALAMPIPRASR